jgi:diguanylate cyclase (GGDEF)-like protein
MNISSSSPLPLSPAAAGRPLAVLLREVLAEQSAQLMLARVARTLRELIHCDQVVVWEYTGGEDLAVAVADGEDTEQLCGLHIAMGEGLSGKAALSREPVVSNQAHLDTRAGLVPGTDRTAEAVACMPLLAHEDLLGVLTIYRLGAGHEFASDEVELVADFAALAALALSHAKARAELESLATTDDLTGLANRRRFYQELEREHAAARRYGSPLSLLLLDLDNFKTINDTYGHHSGDEALRLIGRALQTHVRAPDLAARIGGDEFAILLPQTGYQAATILAQRLARTVAEATGSPLRVTTSIGIATTCGERDVNLLAQADHSLYQQKRCPDRPRVSVKLGNDGLSRRLKAFSPTNMFRARGTTA